MRLPNASTPLSKKIKRQIFLFLIFTPIILLINIAFTFYQINKLIEFSINDSVSRAELIEIINGMYTEIFLAGFFCLLGMLFQILLLAQYVYKIAPKDMALNNDTTDKEILSNIQITNFDEMTVKKSQSEKQETDGKQL